MDKAKSINIWVWSGLAVTHGLLDGAHPIDFVPVDLQLVREAAEIKSEHALSYADAFCVATARRLSATVLTSDPEFHAVEHLITILWLKK